MASGFVYADEHTVSAFSLRLDTLRGECYRALSIAPATWRTFAARLK